MRRTSALVAALAVTVATGGCANRLFMMTNSSMGLNATIPTATADTTSFLPHLDLAIKRSEVVAMDMSTGKELDGNGNPDAYLDQARSTFMAFDVDIGSMATASFRPTAVIQVFATGTAAENLAKREKARRAALDGTSGGTATGGTGTGGEAPAIAAPAKEARTALAKAETEHEKLSSEVAASPTPATPDQTDKLKRLRGRVRALRQRVEELDQKKNTLGRIDELRGKLKDWEAAADALPSAIRDLPIVGWLLRQLGLDGRSPMEREDDRPRDEAAEDAAEEAEADATAEAGAGG